MAAKSSIPGVIEQVHSAFLLASIHQSYGTRQTRVMAPGRPNETYGRVKIPFGPINQIISHWFQLPGATLEWPPITRPGVNATKYRKPWPRTDIIVRWPHDCLSPIMRWPLPKPGQTVSGGALQHFRRIANWLQSDIWQGNEITETCVQFPKLVSWAWSLHCTVQLNAKRAALIDKPGLSGQPASLCSGK